MNSSPAVPWPRSVAHTRTSGNGKSPVVSCQTIEGAR